MYIHRNLYRVQYVIPLYEDKIGHIESVEIKTKDAVREIILTFENPELIQNIKKQQEESVEIVQKYHYMS
jgi:hypothetical protein